MKIDDIIHYTQSYFEGTVTNSNWGEKGIFYNPEMKLKKGIYILTFKETDGPNDKASQLNRGGLYRLNIGIEKESFIRMFDYIPARPAAGQTITIPYDFTKIDAILPHPVYGWMSWISVINPSTETFENIKPLILESYQLAKKKYEKKRL